MKRFYVLFFISILIASLAYKLFIISENNLAFTSDQARDMIEIRQIATHQPIKLVGPITDIIGVYLGPFWYYFNLPAYIVGRGDPVYLVIWQIICYQLSVVCLFLVINKKRPHLALTISTLLLLSPIGFLTARFSFNANSMPIFTILFFAALFWTQERATHQRLLLLGIISGIALQIQAALGIIYFPFCILYFIFNRIKILRLFSLTIGFLITLVPQAVFEITHSFSMTKSFLDEVFQQSDYLGSNLAFLDKLSDRLSYASMLIGGSLYLPNLASLALFAVGSLYIIFYWRKGPIETSLIFFFIANIIFFMVFPNQLKDWYIYGLVVPITIWLALIIKAFWLARYPQTAIIAFVFLAITILTSFNRLSSGLIQKSSNDPSNLNNRLSTIDYVYQMAAGKTFVVYNFSPSVYDYPYQYLFWWYGNAKYHYLPEKITYADNVPEYVKNNTSFFTNQKPLSADYYTFLIIEDGAINAESYKLWRSQIPQLCVTGTKVFSWRTAIEIGYPCPQNEN